MHPIRKICVAGAAGGLGSTISNCLVDAGYEVTCLIRPEDSSANLKVSSERIVRGYIEGCDEVYKALDGAQAAINCAALLPNARHLGHSAFRRVNVDGALNLLRQCEKREVKLAVFFSTISVVDHLNRHITSQQLCDFEGDKDDPYQFSKVEMERALDQEAANFLGSIAILRPAFVYGPGNYAVWSDALELLKTARMRLLDDGKALFPLVFSEDIARFVLHLLNYPLKPHRVFRFVLANPDRTVMREVFDYLAHQLGVPAPRSMPSKVAGVIASIAQCVPASLRKGRLKLLTRARVSQYSKGYDLSGVLEPPPLGFVCDTDYRSGFIEMLRAHR